MQKIEDIRAIQQFNIHNKMDDESDFSEWKLALEKELNIFWQSVVK